MPAVEQTDYSPKLGQFEARATLAAPQANPDIGVARKDTVKDLKPRPAAALD